MCKDSANKLEHLQSPRAVAKALKEQSRSSAQKALLLLKSLESLQANAFYSNAILSGCKHWEEGLDLLKGFRGNACADEVSYNSVLNLLNWQTALALFCNLKTLNGFNNSPNGINQDLKVSNVPYNVLISSGKTEPAGWKNSLNLMLTMAMDQLKCDQFSYMAALDVLKSKSKVQSLWRRSCHILNSMPVSLVQPDVLSWNTVLASALNWTHQLHLLNMRPFSLVPDLISYHSAIRGDWRVSLNVLTSMTKLQMKSNVVTLNSALRSFATNEAWAIATVMMDRMSSHAILPDVLSFNSYLHTLACASGSGLPNSIWVDALQSFARLGLQGDSFTMTSAIRVRSQVAFSEASEVDMFGEGQYGWRQGLNMLEDGRHGGHGKVSRVSSNAVLKECAQVSQWGIALGLLTDASDASGKSDEVSVSTCISACEKASQWQKALLLLCAMPLVRLQRDIVCFGAAASACQKGKQWQLALSLLSDVSDCVLQPNLPTYNAVISACGNAGEWTQALSLLELLGSNANVISYNAVALQLKSTFSFFQKTRGIIREYRNIRYNMI